MSLRPPFHDREAKKTQKVATKKSLLLKQSLHQAMTKAAMVSAHYLRARGTKALVYRMMKLLVQPDMNPKINFVLSGYPNFLG